MCTDRKRARRTASARFKVALQEKVWYTMAIWGHLGRGSVMVRRMRAFAVENEVIVLAADDLANSASALVPGMPL